MRRFATAVIIGGLLALGASFASGAFVWAWDFDPPPTTEFALTNLSYQLIPPPPNANVTKFTVQSDGNAALTLLGYLPYRPDETMFLPYYRNTFSQPALGVSAISMPGSAVQLQLLGYKEDYTPLGPATLATYASSVSGFATLYGIGFSNPDISSAWSEAPKWVKVQYLAEGATAGSFFHLDSATYSVVPEPGTLLIGAALTGLSTLTLRRRARKVKAA